MFAVLKTGGKQYRVQSGDVLRVEKIAAEAGETVQFNDVLMLGGDTTVVGSPLVQDAGVQAEVLDQIKGEKVIHFVRRRRKHSSKRTKGHRQQLTVLRVTEILPEGAEKSGVKAAVGAAGIVLASSKQEMATGPAKETEAKAKPKPKQEDAGTATVDAVEGGIKPANLLEAPRDDQADDLKKLSGVGPKLEALLNENGVYHFDQIAAWTDDEVAWMDDQLSFKGRIGRENWIEQAKTLAAEKE
jgi:large subunit ribosomal protein L21